MDPGKNKKPGGPGGRLQVKGEDGLIASVMRKNTLYKRKGKDSPLVATRRRSSLKKKKKPGRDG